ncbi:sialic acid-binding Ig-like lectin 15 [Megaptera novaeangliae]
MEGSFQLLASLVCIILMGSFVRTKSDTTRNLLDTELHSAPAQRWSMKVPAEVSAAAGEAAVLPFTHPHRHYDGPLTAIWRAGEPYTGPQVFRCAAARSSELCQTALSLHGRFRLLGNPRRNDLSLRVERLALADDGRYFCRVEFAGDAHDRYESRHGVRLRVTAAPRIVNISVLPGPAHTFHALCTAEGEPPPALAWSGPALGNGSAAVPSPGQDHGHQVTAELPALAHDGRYTCAASNSLGRAEASVYLFRFHGASGASAIALPLSALGLKVLLLLGVLAACAAARRRLEYPVTQDTSPRPPKPLSSLLPPLPGLWFGQSETPPVWVVSQLSPVHRPQAQESNYENLNQMSPQGPPAAMCSP